MQEVQICVDGQWEADKENCDVDTGTGADEVIDTGTRESFDTGTGDEVETDTGDAVPVELEWVLIPGGEFAMGSDLFDFGRIPIHLEDFELLRTEVTVAQFQTCVDAGVCVGDYTTAAMDGEPFEDPCCNFDKPDKSDHPMNCVDWYDAQDFCAWAGGRLPSEFEWEYAARSLGQPIEYPWGFDMPTCELAIFAPSPSGNGCGTDSTWPVCSTPAGNTEQGLCDMAGNVYEWMADDYHDRFDGSVPQDGTPWITGEEKRVVRSGGWIYGMYGDIPPEHVLSVSLRGQWPPAFRIPDDGIRCARSLP